MLLFDKYLKHVFIRSDMSKVLIDKGVNMNDAQFFIIKKNDKEYVVGKNELKVLKEKDTSIDGVPTYSLCDFLYKLHEWIIEEDGGKKFSGPLGFMKDAPFYIFTYYNKDENKKEIEEDNFHFKNGKKWLEAYGETPLDGAYRMLLTCINNEVGHVGSISEKYDGEWEAIHEEDCKITEDMYEDTVE